ncbi:hypothetical protein PFISCL1PPCAC_11596, partial [Pristionchus fissidentatus]
SVDTEKEAFVLLHLPSEILASVCYFLPLRARFNLGWSCSRLFKLENEAGRKHLDDVTFTMFRSIHIRSKRFPQGLTSNAPNKAVKLPFEEWSERTKNVFRNATIGIVHFNRLESLISLADFSFLATASYESITAKNWNYKLPKQRSFLKSLVESDKFEK